MIVGDAHTLPFPEGLQSLFDLESSVTWFLSWKDDLTKDDEIRDSQAFEKLQRTHSSVPTCHDLGVALYAVFVGDLIVNNNKDAAEAYADVVAFRNYSTSALKLAKKDVPVELLNYFERLLKDSLSMSKPHPRKKETPTLFAWF